jgi:hypothetical protein
MIWLIGLSVAAAVGVGIWFGLPAKYDQSLDEIDERLNEPGNKHRTVKRRLTFINLLKKEERGSTRRRSSRVPFKSD